MHDRFDAIIIGGGPAGALTAMLLARQAWRVALIEKRTRSQAKTCGHCLDTRANGPLQRAGLLDEIRTMAEQTTGSAVVYLPDTTPLLWSMSREGEYASLVIARGKLDPFMIDRAAEAGVMVIQPASAQVLETTAGKVIVMANDQTLTSTLLIGADGLRSRVAVAAGLSSGASIGKKYGFSFTLADARAVPLDRGTIHMFVRPDGYIGAVHHSDKAMHIAALVQGDRRISPSAFLCSMRETFPQLKAIDSPAPSHIVACGPMPARAMSVANECAALVGDAAGYVEPFTGEGMTWAIQSAELLSRTLSDAAPGHWDSTFARNYCRAWSRAVAQRQRFCRSMAWALQRPRLMRSLVLLANLQPQLAHRIAKRVLAA